MSNVPRYSPMRLVFRAAGEWGLSPDELLDPRCQWCREYQRALMFMLYAHCTTQDMPPIVHAFLSGKPATTGNSRVWNAKQVYLSDTEAGRMMRLRVSAVLNKLAPRVSR